MGTASPQLPRRRSLAIWAALALGMVLASYAFILITAAACVYLPYFVLMHSSGTAGLQTILLLLFGAVMACTMIWSLIPRRDHFVPRGSQLDRSSHPRLFAELENIASLLNEPLPSEVYLIPEPNAFVADRGGIMGFGARRVMGIGLPLVSILNVTEFRAVLAHEFGHYYSGDTRLGPWVYKTRLALARTIQNMLSLRSVMRVALVQIVYGIVMGVLRAYWAVFFRATQGISRRQEYRADELACYVSGSRSFVSGLTKIPSAIAAFPAYWASEVAPLLNVGRRPPIAEGFALFVSAPEISKQIEEFLRKELDHTEAQAYDSHPKLRDRIANAQRLDLQQPENQNSSAPASSLFGNLLGEEARILRMSNTGLRVDELQTVSWDELPAILPAIWEKVVTEHAQFLGDATPDSLPEMIPRMAEIGSRMPDPKGMLLTPEQRTARALELFGMALALLIVRAGWKLSMKPGERYYQCGEERLSVRELISGLASKKISKEQWVSRCQALKISGSPLAANATSAGMPQAMAR